MYPAAQPLYQKPHQYSKGGRPSRAGRLGVVMPSQLANSAVAADRAIHPPQIIPSGGDAGRGQTVVIENHPLNADCAIFYTTDGSQPTLQSQCYDQPFTIQPPVRPQLAVRAMAASTIRSFSKPTTEIFSFDPATVEPTPDPSWQVLPGGVFDIVAAEGATVYFTIEPNPDVLHREGYLYQGRFRLMPAVETEYKLTAVAVLPSRPRSRAVTIHEKVPAGVLVGAPVMVGTTPGPSREATPQMLSLQTPAAAGGGGSFIGTPLPPSARPPAVPVAVGADIGVNTTPARSSISQLLLPAPQVLVVDNPGPPRAVVLTLTDKPSAVKRALFATPTSTHRGSLPIPDHKLRVYYSYNDAPWCPWPESEYLSIPLEPPHDVVRKYAVTYAFAPPTDVLRGGHGVTYLYIPPTVVLPPPQVVAATSPARPPPPPTPQPVREKPARQRDDAFMFQQALKWLWEVISRVQALHDQWGFQGWVAEKQELVLCAAKLESAVLLALVHLASEEGPPAQYMASDAQPREGETLKKIHFQEASDAALSLYHLLLSAQRQGPAAAGSADGAGPADADANDMVKHIVDCLTRAMGKVRVLAELIPDTPVDKDKGVPVPGWLNRAVETIGKCDPQAANNLAVLDARSVAAQCNNHGGDLKDHAEAMGGFIGRLAKRVEDTDAENARLAAELHQSRVDADELRNKIDELVAAVQAGRIREVKLEARVEELRRCVADHAPPMPSAHASAQIGYGGGGESHVAFLLNPDP